MIEIGGGAGHVAEAAFRGEAGPFTGARWTSVDLSPALIAAQRRRLLEPSQPRGAHPRWSGVRADAVSLPVRSASVDGLLLANEVIADLPVENGRNTGALQLVQEISASSLPGEPPSSPNSAAISRPVHCGCSPPSARAST